MKKAARRIPTDGRNRTALYARVSTRDKQETENQLRELRRFARSQNWKVTQEYIDRASGKLGTAGRGEFARLFQEAEQGKFDIVLFWSLDRFSREGARETLNHLNRLETAGVKYRSFTQAYFNTAGPFREALVSILATLAEQERSLINSRITAGMDRAKAKGVKFGRPRRVVNSEKLVRDHDAGASLAELAKKYKISKATAFRRIQAWRKKKSHDRSTQTRPTRAGARRAAAVGMQ